MPADANVATVYNKLTLPGVRGMFGGTVTKPENLSSGIDLSASKNLASFADLGSGGGFSFGKKTEGFSFAGTGASVFGK